VSLASEHAYEALVADILSGVFPIGHRIREEEVAARVGTSRTPVREALRRLTAEGLVDLQPHRGAVVRSSMYQIEELYELRALIEGYGAGRAAGRRQESDLAGLGELCDRMDAVVERGADMGEITQLNLAFHRQVQVAAGIDRIVGALPGLTVGPLVRETFRHYTPAELTRSMRQHRELVEAMAARDGEWARSVMAAHIYAGRAALLRLTREAATSLADGQVAGAPDPWTPETGHGGLHPPVGGAGQ
jgi:DNA-binding GntR family transcriptional regulator